jgi:two-component system, LuxR family, sensor kinase FixL
MPADKGDAVRQDIPIGQQTLTVFALAVAYVVLEWVSSTHEYRGLPFTAWDPGLGLMFSALILHTRTSAAALFLGTCASEVVFRHSALDWARVAAIATILTGVYTLVVHAIRRTEAFDPSLPRLRDVVILLGGAAAGAILSAFLLLNLLILTGNLGIADIVAAGWPHIIGDTIGIAVVAPLCLKLAAKFPRRDFKLSSNIATEVAFFFLVLAVFAWLVTGSPTRESLQYFYMLFIPVMIAAVRHGLTGASIALAATQLALVLILDWIGAGSDSFTASHWPFCWRKRDRAGHLDASSASDGAGSSPRSAFQSRKRNGGRLVT